MSTTSAPFRAKRKDGRAVWRVAYDHISREIDAGRLKDGEFVDHEQLSAVMETEARTSYYYTAMNRAREELQKTHSRDLVAVKGVGYQLVAGLAQVDHGKAQHKSAKRKMGKALATITSADLSVMSEAEIRSTTNLRDGMNWMYRVLGLTVEEVLQHRKDIGELKEAREEALRSRRATDDQVAAMEARLNRIEREREEERQRV